MLYNKVKSQEKIMRIISLKQQRNEEGWCILWHICPENPGAHVHRKPLIPFNAHVPEFKHGLDEHGSTENKIMMMLDSLS